MTYISSSNLKFHQYDPARYDFEFAGILGVDKTPLLHTDSLMMSLLVSELPSVYCHEFSYIREGLL